MVKRKREHKPVAELLHDLQSQATFVRRSAIIDLAARRNRDSLQPLIGLLFDREASIRACAAWALGELGDEASSAALSGALKDKDVEVRRCAAQSLETLCPPQAEAALLEARVDSDKWVSEWASRALARLANLPSARKRKRLLAEAPEPFELKP